MSRPSLTTTTSTTTSPLCASLSSEARLRNETQIRTITIVKRQHMAKYRRSVGLVSLLLLQLPPPLLLSSVSPTSESTSGRGCGRVSTLLRGGETLLLYKTKPSVCPNFSVNLFSRVSVANLSRDQCEEFSSKHCVAKAFLQLLCFESLTVLTLTFTLTRKMF